MDKCASIVMFLEKQSGLFLDTANQLAGMARETLVILPHPHHVGVGGEVISIELLPTSRFEFMVKSKFPSVAHNINYCIVIEEGRRYTTTVYFSPHA